MNDQDKRAETLELEYSTMLQEPIGCLVYPYGCKLEKYTKMLAGKLKLSNVDVSGFQDTYDPNWDYGKGKDKIEIYVTIDKSTDASNKVKDMLVFRYNWNKADAESGKGRWTCSDQHNDPKTKKNVLDQYQDCIIFNEGSSITFVEEDGEDGKKKRNGKANLVVAFARKFDTNENDQDAQLKIGEKVLISEFYWSAGSASGYKASDATINLILKNGAKALAASVLAAVSLLIY